MVQGKRDEPIKAVRNKEMGHLAAAKQYNVPRSTLCD
jgi:hypothetical protein